MMGVDSPGEVHDILTMCDYMGGNSNAEWIKEGLVTGFKGPFEGQPENPSSVIIDELEKEGVEKKVLSLQKLEMTYHEVSKNVPELLKEKRRDFVLHIAPHTIKNRIYLEQRAFSNGYLQPDSTGFIPEGNKTTCESDQSEIEYGENCEDHAKTLNEKCGLDGEKYGGLLVEKSEDPGRFVEGYTYFLSLHKSRWTTLLVKIPPFEGEVTKEVVAKVIREVMKAAF